VRPDFNFRYQPLMMRFCLFKSRHIGGGDADQAIVIDIDFNSGLFDDRADLFSSRA